MYRLRIIRGPNSGLEWEVPEGVTTAGRDLGNPICLPDLHVSRQHFQVSRRGDTCTVRNLSRTNGTFVNGDQVVESTIQPGDQVLVGETLLELKREGGSEGSLNLSDAADSTVVWLGDEDEEAASNNINYTVNARAADLLQVDQAETNMARLREVTKRLRMLQDLGNSLVTEFEPSKLLNIFIDRLMDVLPADSCHIFVREGDSDRLGLHASRMRSDLSGTSDGVRVSRTLVMRAITERIGILSGDTLKDERFKDQGSIIMSGIRSAMCVPMLYGDDMLGLIYLDSRTLDRQFGQEDLKLLTVMANQAAISLRNARLREQVVAEETVRAALGNYVPPQLLERIIRGEITVKSEAKDVRVSVLFADIRGFTTLSERLSPNEVMNLLNEYCGRMAKLVFDHSGLIDKYIGDAVMAVFGSPEPEPLHALKAVECAVAMQHAARNLSVKGQPVYIGIGVHTGPCVQGHVGSAGMMQFTAVGDTVNTASRLCSAADGGQIVISEATLDAAGHLPYGFDAMDPIGLKGKTKPLQTYQIRVPSSSQPHVSYPTQERNLSSGFSGGAKSTSPQ